MCTAECVALPRWTQTHTEVGPHLGCTHAAFAASAGPLRPGGHALTPWQTRYPGPPRARHQASQEATGNSNPAWAPQTRSGDCARRAHCRVGEHRGQWGSGVPTLPRLALPSQRRLCPEVSSGIFHFMEQPPCWEGKEMFWAQDPVPCWAPSPGLGISLMLEGASWSCESYLSCPLLQGIFLTSLDCMFLPLSGPDH